MPTPPAERIKELVGAGAQEVRLGRVGPGEGSFVTVAVASTDFGRPADSGSVCLPPGCNCPRPGSSTRREPWRRTRSPGSRFRRRPTSQELSARLASPPAMVPQNPPPAPAELLPPPPTVPPVPSTSLCREATGPVCDPPPPAMVAIVTLAATYVRGMAGDDVAADRLAPRSQDHRAPLEPQRPLVVRADLEGHVVGGAYEVRGRVGSCVAGESPYRRRPFRTTIPPGR